MTLEASLIFYPAVVVGMALFFLFAVEHCDDIRETLIIGGAFGLAVDLLCGIYQVLGWM